MNWRSFPGRWNALDRRFIYLCMLVAVAVPMIWRVTFRERPSPMVRNVFALVEALPPESRVLLVYDYDSAAQPEMKPMADAFSRHLALKRAKLILLTLWPLGQSEIDLSVRTVLQPEFPDYQYGVDFVNLGYMSGNEGVIAISLTDLKKGIPTDVHNISTSDMKRLPVLRGVDNLRNLDLIVEVAAGYPGLREWIQYASVPGRIPIVGGSAAVKSPELFPYVPSQCIGLLAGIKGAAEYEQMLIERYPQFDRPECRTALERMGPQTVAHLMVMVLIVLGNAAHLAERKERRR
jgi:RES domain-containing protein